MLGRLYQSYPEFQIMIQSTKQRGNVSVKELISNHICFMHKKVDF